MSDWEAFVAEVTWFPRQGSSAVVGPPRPWTRGGVDGLPVLSALLNAATLTTVGVDGSRFELLAWGPQEARRGWLCHPPVVTEEARVHDDQRRLWSAFGGIVEQFGEPVCWWNNQDEVLTETAAAFDLGGVFADYAWLWGDDGLSIPISPHDYYPIAVEANGNLTLAHRRTGAVLIFAPDHDYDGITPVAGCPPYSLMTIDDISDLSSWIEANAAAWSGPR